MNSEPTYVKVALVDDHIIFRTALAGRINESRNYRVIQQASNGKELLDNIDNASTPHLVILDLSMPVMNGFETAGAINKKYPQIAVVILTMYDDELNLM